MTSFEKSYAEQARREIEKWKSKGRGFLPKMINVALKPVWKTVKVVTPELLRKTIEEAVRGFFESMFDGSKYTFSEESVMHRARKFGIDVVKIEQLQYCPLSKLDKVARGYLGSNKILAMIEGGACGAGGYFTIVLDIPLLFGIGFRAVRQIGACYGIDLSDPEYRPIVYRIFDAGCTKSVAAKEAALVDMKNAALMLAKKWTYSKVAKRTGSGFLLKELKQFSKKLPSRIAQNITKKKMAQSAPYVGAAIGAGFNYRFLSNLTIAAYMLFRQVHLEFQYA